MPYIMKNTLLRVITFLAVAFPFSTTYGQYTWYYQWGILPDNIIDNFIGESSGERAYNHIAELSEYNRQRTVSEFSGTLMESQYIIDRLNEYGLSDVKIERFEKVNSWRGKIGRAHV
jgi:hypothetical protein